MCRVQSHRQSELGSSASVDRTARKVVRKYRKMTLRREMRRLRRLVLEEGEAGRVSSGQLLERTVSLIEDLEARLLQRLSQGAVPERLRGSNVQSVEDIRNVIGLMMASQ